MFNNYDNWEAYCRTAEEKCKVLENKIQQLELENKNLEDTNKRYIMYPYQFLDIILKYQANDITKEQLFEKAKEYTQPDTYTRMYHMIVLKDYLGFTGGITEQELKDNNVKEDDTNTLVINDLLSDNVPEDDTENIEINEKLIEDQFIKNNI